MADDIEYRLFVAGPRNVDAKLFLDYLVKWSEAKHLRTREINGRTHYCICTVYHPGLAEVEKKAKLGVWESVHVIEGARERF